MPEDLETNAFFHTSRGLPLDTLLDDPTLTNAAPTASSTPATTDTMERRTPAPGILKKRAVQQLPVSDSLVPHNGGGSILKTSSGRRRRGLEKRDSQRPVGNRPPTEEGGRIRREATPVPARSAVGSESGLTNYEDDNTSLGGWR
jgi:hypothetical protein